MRFAGQRLSIIRLLYMKNPDLSGFLVAGSAKFVNFPIMLIEEEEVQVNFCDNCGLEILMIDEDVPTWVF